MPTYEFTLVLSRADVMSDAAGDALYDAGCDDATFGTVDGVAYATFNRDAAALAEALTSAIADVQRGVAGVRVVHVEPDELVTMSEIADRTGRSRESVRLLTAGERGDGTFPAPTSHLRTRNRLWRWPEVARWFARHDGSVAEPAAELVDTIAAFNAVLAWREHRGHLDAAARKQLEELLAG